MNLSALLRLATALLLLAAAVPNVNAARKVILRPLSAEEVVKILKQAGREDAIPEGRVVTQGLAAITGFALGLTKGIGGSLLFDLATSNATAEFINNFNSSAMMTDFQGINMTALVQLFPWGTANNADTIKYKKTEICFDTISEDLVFDQKARQADFEMAPTTSGTFGSNVGDKYAANTNVGGGDHTSIDNSFTTTQTDERNRQTCLLFIKPILRKQRSLLRKRRQ